MFDAEQIRSCTFLLHAKVSDMTVSIAEATVNIRDVNDNPPKFVYGLYSGEVFESRASYSHVRDVDSEEDMIVQAVDPDISNTAVKYSILEDSMRMYFNVDENTGEITTNTVSIYL